MYYMDRYDSSFNEDDYGIGLTRLELDIIQRHVKDTWLIMRDPSLSKEEAFDQLEEALTTLMRMIN